MLHTAALKLLLFEDRRDNGVSEDSIENGAVATNSSVDMNANTKLTENTGMHQFGF